MKLTPEYLPDIILGHHCFLCAAQQPNFMCQPCRKTLKYRYTACPHCALPTPSGATCPECQQTPPVFTRSICAFEYRFPLPFMINQYKHHRHLRCGKELTLYLAKKIKDQYHHGTLPDFLIPVPLHWKRRLKRGFNQAEYVATELSRHLTLPINRSVQKTSHSASQQTLTRKERLKNLSGNYDLKKNTRNMLKDKHVAIIDDVITTGATAESISRLLISKAGVARVDVWALARTPKDA